jgi:hypothetical protein
MPNHACPQCAASLLAGVEFCGTCGANVPEATDLTATDRMAQFRAHVIATLREGTPLADLLDDLVEEATEMGIGKATAVELIEQVYSEAQAEASAAVRLWYDADRAGAGVAQGNTIVAFRITNASTRAIQSIVITVQHPQSLELVTLPPVTTLNKESTKYTETDLVFERVGRHSIRAGWVEVRRLTGATVVYRFDDVVRLNAENHDAARSHIQSISQTIQTHGGGVVSAGGLDAADTTRAKSAAWEEIRLTISSAEALREARIMAASNKATPAPELEPLDLLPAAPSHLSVIPQSPSTALLTWTDNSTNEQGFQIERSAAGTHFVLMATIGPESASYLATGLPPGSACAFRIRAFNTSGNSPYSNVASTVLPELVKEVHAAAPPPVPQSIQVVVHAPSTHVVMPAAAPTPKPEQVLAPTTIGAESPAPASSTFATIVVNVVAAFIAIGGLLYVAKMLGFAVA